MPDNRHNAVANPSTNSPDKLEEAVWHLKIEDGHVGADGQPNQYPDRPGEPDCIYYLRNGVCGYGNKCRYNHPTYTGQGTPYRGELPKRDGQPDCQFYLKTGTCKFGHLCKYHHPQDKHNSRPIQINALGLPMRKDEKSCPHYMRTGSCKFGIACKFNHPQPTASFGAVLPVTGPSAHEYTGSSAPTTGPPIIGGPSTWLLSRNSPHMQGLPTYMPLVLPSSTMHTQQGWSMYMGSLNIPTNDAVGPNQILNSKHHGQPGSSMLVSFPERPDQPECQYYMKTGSCKYGANCKYHHPKERNQEAACTIGPLGLPLRPGQPMCGFYTTHGSCKYGTACKFDHPLMGYYNYSLPVYTFQEPLVIFPNQRVSQVKLTLSENSSSKTSKVSDQLIKSERSNEPQDLDNSDHDNPSTQTSPSHTATHSDSPQNQSD